jgi:hypothetical protein
VTTDGAVPVLLRVVPLTQQLGLEGGGTLVLISLELWQDFLTIAWLEAPPIDEQRSRSTPPHWSVEDDAGTLYRRVAGGAGGGSTYLRGTVSFNPAPPEAASVLRITPPRVLHGSFSVLLR